MSFQGETSRFRIVLATSDSATFCATCTTLLCTYLDSTCNNARPAATDPPHLGKPCGQMQHHHVHCTALCNTNRWDSRQRYNTSRKWCYPDITCVTGLPRPPIPVLPVHLVPLPQTHALHRPAHNSVRSVLWPPKARRSLATIVHKVDTTRTAKANAVIAPLVGPRCQAAFNARNVKQVFMVLL